MRQRRSLRTTLAGLAATCLTGSLIALPAVSGSAQAASGSLGNEGVMGLQAQTSPNWFYPTESAAAYTDLNGQMSAMLYVPLINVNSHDDIVFDNAVADRITYNRSGTVYDIYLKPNLKWSDGRPVTSADVLFAWQVTDGASGTSPKLPWQYGGAQADGMPYDWKSVVAKGPHEVVITTTQAVNPQWFIHNDISQLYPVPSFVWNKDPHNMVAELKFIQSVANSPTNPVYDVVDGPFKFSGMVPNQYWAFVANPTYGAGPKATIRKLVFQYETSPDAAFAALKGGTVNVGFLPFSMYSTRSQLSGDTLVPLYTFGYNYLQPDEMKNAAQVKAAFSNLYVRQALQMGINQPGIIRAFYDGFGVPENGPVPSKPRTSFYDAKLPTLYPFNPAAGKKLLQAHGWRLVNGVMTKDGVALKFTFLYASGSNTDDAIAQYLKSTWAQEGIQVTLEQQQANTIFTYNTSNPGKWAMVWWGSGWTYVPDFYPTGGELFASGAVNDSMGYDNAKMNALIKETYLPGTASQLTSRMDAYLLYADQQLPVLWMPYFPYLVEHANNIHGVIASFNSIMDLWWPNEWRVSG